jgi:hypothetical protein
MKMLKNNKNIYSEHNVIAEEIEILHNSISPSESTELLHNVDDQNLVAVEQRKTGLLHLLIFLFLLLFGLGNRVFNKIQTIPMNNYPLFLSIYTTFIYIPACFLYIIPVLYCTSWIPKGNKNKEKFMVYGIFNGSFRTA